MTNEILIKPKAGYGMLFLLLLGIVATVASFVLANEFPILHLSGLLLAIATFLGLFGFIVVNPNESRVLTLFGTYKGSVKDSGFYWVNPFISKKPISLRARNLESKTIKVNDKVGNPIEIGMVLVWKVEETAQAAFAVDDYIKYVEVQSEAALRHLAGLYAYDHFEEDTSNSVTLRDGGETINHLLEEELKERLKMAGINVVEARITHLAYAPEIAGAMLQRQQAMAVVAARTKIVEGAVGMVEMALDKLSQKKIVELDEERKATMVSNLLVVLCSEKAASPVVNAGSLY
ncbi:MAG: SPFH domain-containing protein [Raineya sp.]|jgi:regulator of protease activity HflC (stomatin/prohibitin superfamily)|nr:SPFH domain-containing protein [Raineya sp.]